MRGAGDRRDQRRILIAYQLTEIERIIDALLAAEHGVDAARAARDIVWSRTQRARIEAAKTHIHLARAALQLNLTDLTPTAV